MKQLAFLLTMILLIGCNKADNDVILGGDQVEQRYFTVTNGHASLNLYPHGYKGLAPGETSETFTIQGNSTLYFKYKWSDNMDVMETLVVDLSEEKPFSTKNFTLSK